MSAAYTSIIDLCLCPFFPENYFYPFLLKFSLFLLRWNFEGLCFDLLLEQPNAQQLSGMF